MYRVAADVNGVEYRPVFLNDDYSLDTEKLLDASDALTKAIFLCSPNNPTGNAFPVEQILDIARRFNGVVVVDEAYIDFSEKGTVAGCGLKNIIVLQTMSKAHAMAGLRIGLAFASREIIDIFNNVKYPYNISCAAIDKCLQMLDEDFESEVESIIKQRARLSEELKKFGVIRKIYDSDANFLLVKVDEPDRIYRYLVDRGIIVRNRNSVKGCEGCLRITIGTPEENDNLLKMMAAL